MAEPTTSLQRMPIPHVNGCTHLHQSNYLSHLRKSCGRQVRNHNTKSCYTPQKRSPVSALPKLLEEWHREKSSAAWGRERELSLCARPTAEKKKHSSWTDFLRPLPLAQTWSEYLEIPQPKVLVTFPSFTPGKHGQKANLQLNRQARKESLGVLPETRNSPYCTETQHLVKPKVCSLTNQPSFTDRAFALARHWAETCFSASLVFCFGLGLVWVFFFLPCVTASIC